MYESVRFWAEPAKTGHDKLPPVLLCHVSGFTDDVSLFLLPE
ncbi:MAG: hypothetical protein R3B66_10965 [Candidatus Scalinduaceae bacterium]